MSHYEQFFVRPEDVTAAAFTLRDQEVVHALRVCRKRLGDWLIATDGEGHRYQGEIRSVGPESLVVSLRQIDSGFNEPQLHLTLAQAMLKGAHFDEVVEKGTEIGVSCFQPLITERTMIDPSAHRLARWQEKARAAMKQCGRSVCPPVRAPLPLDRLLEEIDRCVCVLAHPANRHANPLIFAGRPVLLLIGPEGGFTEEEVNTCLSRGAIPFSLGARRLRSETAALAASTLILAQAGDLAKQK